MRREDNAVDYRSKLAAWQALSRRDRRFDIGLAQILTLDGQGGAVVFRGGVEAAIAQALSSCCLWEDERLVMMLCDIGDHAAMAIPVTSAQVVNAWLRAE
jgi:hypothetical protein